MSTDDALAFQNSAIAGALDAVDLPDDTLESEDPLSNNSLPDKHDRTAKKADRRERYTEAPRLLVRGVAYEDPDAMPHRINGRYLTAPTRARDRSLLDAPMKSPKPPKARKHA